MNDTLIDRIIWTIEDLPWGDWFYTFCTWYLIIFGIAVVLVIVGVTYGEIYWRRHVPKETRDRINREFKERQRLEEIVENRRQLVEDREWVKNNPCLNLFFGRDP